MSSAKRRGIHLLFKMIGKSLMCNRNNKGPKIDPWGTALLNSLELE
jgi:hypothetical protein